jgi:cytoskeleton protein RodZ
MDIKIPKENSANNLRDTNDSIQNNSLGNTFYTERTKKNLSLKEVAESTCIHIATLRAIEAGDREKMPAEVFSRGFVKLYAEYLDLDTQDIMDLYNNEIVALGGTGQESNDLSELYTYTDKSPLITLPNILLLLFFFFVIFIGYWLWTGENSPFSRQSRNTYFEKYYVERNSSLYAAKKESSNTDTSGSSIATSIH